MSLSIPTVEINSRQFITDSDGNRFQLRLHDNSLYIMKMNLDGTVTDGGELILDPLPDSVLIGGNGEATAEAVDASATLDSTPEVFVGTLQDDFIVTMENSTGGTVAVTSVDEGSAIVAFTTFFPIGTDQSTIDTAIAILDNDAGLQAALATSTNTSLAATTVAKTAGFTVTQSVAKPPSKITSVVYDEGSTGAPTIAAGTEGGGGSSLDQLQNPASMVIDSAGALYVSDTENHRVVKWDEGASAGVIVAGTGTSGSGLSQISYPQGIALDSSGNLYVADKGNHCVMKWEPGATAGVVVAGIRGVMPTQDYETNKLKYPTAMTILPDGRLVISCGLNRCLKWTPGASDGELFLKVSSPRGYNFDAAGAMYFTTNSAVYKVTDFDPPGQPLYESQAGTQVAGSGGTGSGLNSLNGPAGLDVAADGTLYIADTGNHRVVVWAPGATEGVKYNNTSYVFASGVILTGGSVIILIGSYHKIIRIDPPQNASVSFTVMGLFASIKYRLAENATLTETLQINDNPITAPSNPNSFSIIAELHGAEALLHSFTYVN